MTIHALILHNFRNYADVGLDFSERRTLLVGPNGAGKSTIFDAIAWALTGRCRGVNGKGEGQRDLIRAGADAMSVTVKLEPLGTITRTYDAQGRTTCTMPTEVILAKLNVSAPLFAAVLNGRAFFDLDHKAAKDALLALLGVEIPADKLPTMVKRPGGDTGAVSLYELDEMYKTAYERRAVVKRQAAALGTAKVFTPRADFEGIDRTVLHEKVADLTSRAIAAGSAHGRVLGLVESLAARIKAVEAAPNTQTLRGRLDVHTAGLVKAKADEAAALKALDDLRAAPVSASGALGQQQREIQVLIERLRRHTPESGCVLAADIPCRTAAKEFAGHIGGLTDDLKRLTDEIKAASAYETDLRATEKLVLKHGQDVRYSETQVAEATAALDAADKAADILKALKAEHAQAKKELAPAKELMDETARVAAEKALVSQELLAYREAKRVFEHDRETRHNLAEEIDEAEQAVKALGPNGLRTVYLDAALKDFTARVNEGLMPFGFTLAIQVEPWAVLIGAQGGAETRPYAMLSAGEQLWTAFAFQLALAGVAGLDFAALDAAEVVVGEARNLLTDLLLDSPCGQVIVAMAKGINEPLPALDGLQVVKVNALDTIPV